MKCIGAFLAVGALAAGIGLARDAGVMGVPVSIVTTVEAPKNAPAPNLTPNDVLVIQDKQKAPVTSLTPLREQGGLQLWLLIDDGAKSDLANRIGDLRAFIEGQPAGTQVGIGYMRNGTVQPVQALTADHAAAAKAIRLPTAVAGIAGSPYLALKDLIHKWPAANQPREVLMVTSGSDPDFGNGPDNIYLWQARDAAQRAGIVVHAIYFPGAGRWDRDDVRIHWGQNYLTELTEETGGKFYWQGDIPPVSLAPDLDDLNRRLNNQYLLTFQAGEGKSGLQPIKLSTELPHVKLIGPAQVYVPR